MRYFFGIFLFLFSITSSLNAGDFRLTGTNMGSQNYVKLQWNPSTLTGNYSYTLYQSDDNGTSFQTTSTNYDKTINVLNVYPDIVGSDKLKAWMETEPIDGIAGAGKGKILVTEVSISKFNTNPDGYLKSAGSYQYDVIVFGSWNVNNWLDISLAARNATEAFIQSGRGVLFGHDVPFNYDYTPPTGVHANFNYLAINYLNMDLSYIGTDGVAAPGKLKAVTSNQVKAVKDGFLLQYPWAITHNSILTIPTTHSSAQLAKGLVWMKFHNPSGLIVDEVNGTNDFYLTTWNNTAMIQTGHSNGAATTDEMKIIANVLWYLAQFTTETTANVRSAMDKAKPIVPTVFRAQNSKANITTHDKGTPYRFYVKATDLTNSANVFYSDTIKINTVAHLKGYFISEDTHPNGVPPIATDGSGNIVTPITAAGIDYQQILHNANPAKYLHVQAVDSVGNLSAVRTLAPPSVFADTVWFFGQNVSTAKTSPGMIFDNYVPTDASKKTLVNSQGTNFSMGVKTCDGYAFYTTYNGTEGVMYNSKHEPMGVFPAPANSTDGYAGAYIGGNKYAFFVVSPTDELNYYIVDMNKDGGYGELIFQRKIASNITQGVEVLPKDGTRDAYWLVYYNKSTNRLHIDALKVETITTGSNLTFPILGGEIPSGGDAIVRSADNTQLAFLYTTTGWGVVSHMSIFDFNTLTGAVTPKVNTLVAGDSPGAVTPFSLAFTPDGQYCVSTGKPAQFTIVAVDGSSNVTIEIGGGGAVGGGGSVGPASGGGGLKLGPDGIMYQKTDKYIAQILWNGQNPSVNTIFATSDNGENFSIGLTPPAINPPVNGIVGDAPEGVDDIVIAHIGESTSFDPTLNDIDLDGDEISLRDVSFAVPADVAKGIFTVDKDHNKVTFTPSTTYPFTGNEEVVLNYKIYTKYGSMGCGDAKITITIKKRIEAFDDKAIIFACGTIETDVTQNDISVTGTTVSVVLPQSAKKGTASVNGDRVIYNHAGADCETKIGVDTVKYDICYLSICDTAKIVITILKKPNITLQDSCSFTPKMALDLQYDGTYQWQYCATNSTTDTDWTNIAYTSISCTEVKEGWYRVRIAYNGAQTITTARQLVQLKKIQLPNGIWYQMELSN